MLSITVMRDRALVSWNVRTIPDRATCDAPVFAIVLPSKVQRAALSAGTPPISRFALVGLGGASLAALEPLAWLTLLAGALGVLAAPTLGVLAGFASIASIGVLFVGLAGADAARLGAGLTAFEILSDTCVELVLQHIPGTRRPLNAVRSSSEQG